MALPVRRFDARRHRYTFAFGLSFVLAFLTASPIADFWTRVGGDFLTPLAAKIVGDEPIASSWPIAVIVIDEATHNSPPFDETPEVAWTPYLGNVINALHEANAAVIGLDIIYPKTIAGRGLAPGFDREFLQSLAAAGRNGKLVLSETRLSETPIRPYRGQEIAVGGADNIRPVHLTPDADNVVRRHPAFLSLENGERVHSFAGEISARLGVAPTNDILIDFVTPRSQFFAFRFSDIYDCIAAGKAEDMKIFEGKAVLIGTALDIEDRHVAANRFQRDKDFSNLQSPCGVATSDTETSIYRASTSGVFVEARALYTFYRDTGPKIPDRILMFVSGLVFLAGLAFLFLRVGPLPGAIGVSLASGALWALGAISLSQTVYGAGVLLPVLPWLLAAAVSFVAIYSYRVILEDQSKRWVTHAFRHYLSPTLVSKLAQEPDSLKLGGERRRVAVLFADLAGFTSTSEKLSDRPEELVSHLNQFFEIMAQKIEMHDGYIDKFIGDAVMGIWGAPVAVENVEQKAAEAALACAAAIDAWNAEQADDNAQPINIRFGVSAGEVIAGNLGSKDRFNYTVIGDAVNRAARLEQENKRVGTRILVDHSIAAHLNSEILTKFIEETALRGQKKTTKLYELRQDAP
ncbi:MAG: CHASE2 domain-containing protein [Marinicaulis sp.]|nr:CHASE2 domain-containing protein [Marinicaulis sp.]NNL89026.1 CHASE2 domain-containing protein [Marinicaulis sp.]